VSEWLPARVRPRAMAILSITIPMGGLIGGSGVLALLPILGWRGCFIACGLLTLVMAGLIVVLLPESPGFLAAKGRRAEAERLLARIAHTTPVASPEVPREATKASSSVFTRANLRLNTCGWLAFFCLQLIGYGFISWTPVLLTMVGWPLDHAIRGSLVFNLSAVCASLAAGWLLARFPLRPLVLGGCFGAVLALAALYAITTATPMPLTTSYEWLTLAGVSLTSIFAGFGIAAIYTLLPFAYPVACRAGGMGFGLMAGRAGGITISFIGGMLLAIDGDSLLPFFATLAVAAVVAAISIVILGPRYAGRLRDLVQA
jgi:AAHS family 4-hydroxybenzoate transporter-like MFS transporter